MPNKSLVLVLGAGASKEVDLPVGAELKQQIANRLDIRFANFSEQISGDFNLTNAFRLDSVRSDGSQGDINPLLHVSWLIRDAMPQAISIDNFIDSHRNDERIAFCGKLAIAQSILAEETRSKLFVSRSNIYNKLDFSSIQSTWFNAFFQLLTENCQKDDLADRLEKIAVISFNYDRCFEHYLYLAIQNYYGMTASEAAEMLALLEVHHPYGKVGTLPWISQTGAIEYGATPNPKQLIEITKLLRTFTQGTDPSVSDIESIRATIAGSERTLFLGFAFHRLNLDLLFSGLPSRTKNVFATAVDISKSNSLRIQYELVDKAKYPFDGIHIRNDLTCANLFKEYSRSLSLI